MKVFNHEWLASVIAAHPEQKVVGRLRLQKTMYLLQQLGLPTQYCFRMYYYGPYSDGLKDEVSFLEQAGLVKEREIGGARGSYFVLQAQGNAELPGIGEFQEHIDTISPYSVDALELAVTYHFFLHYCGEEQEALRRLRDKKGMKCSSESLRKASELLGALKLGSIPSAA